MSAAECARRTFGGPRRRRDDAAATDARRAIAAHIALR
jgi:hypothetical protein